MGNCITADSSENRSLKPEPYKQPIETTFKLPSPLPSWPPGEGFATGIIDLGELRLRQISSFDKVWTTHEGGLDNLGATFFDPSTSSELQQGFFILGYYTQPNNTPLFGSVLAVSEKTETGNALRKPIDYVLVWSSESSKIKQDGFGYFWLPVAPDGYEALGYVVTNSSEKPLNDKIRCVRTDLTEQAENDSWVWGPGNESNESGFDVYGLRPSNRGIDGKGVCIGTFTTQPKTPSNSDTMTSLPCLKNVEPDSTSSSMPNIKQIEALFTEYSPLIYFHPKEKYLQSSLDWYFDNGALLYRKGGDSKPISIEPNGSNLPQGGSNDNEYWIDLPIDEKTKGKVKKGNLQNNKVYLHIKPMFGATFTDIVVWSFYPYNGPATAKVGLLNIPLVKIGEHVGDWEHVTLRISNFDGELKSVFFSQHGKGSWVKSSELEFRNGTNKVVGYASLNGHAMYSKPGLVLQGSGDIGIRNDTAKSDVFFDTGGGGGGGGFAIVAAEYLGNGGGGGGVVEPPWLNYCREWGPKIDYDFTVEVKKIEKLLPEKYRSEFEKFMNRLPNEVLGEEGPTGPKMKRSWFGDEV